MNIAVLGERNIERFGEYASIWFEEREYTNLEIFELAKRFSNALIEIGILLFVVTFIVRAIAQGLIWQITRKSGMKG